MGQDTQPYKLLIFLLHNPSQDHNLKKIIREEMGLSDRVDFSDKGRNLKMKIKKALQKVLPNDKKKELDKLLPVINKGNIRLNLSKKDIFFL